MSECIIWPGARTSKGYGSRTVNGSHVLAHRHAYAEAYGEPPVGAQIHHECGVRLCINPAHLSPVTPLEHNRLAGAVGTLIDEIMADGEWWRPRDVRARLGRWYAPKTVLMAIRRGVERGDYERGGHGWYRRVVRGGGSA